jgi:hypothetical protein
LRAFVDFVKADNRQGLESRLIQFNT